MTVSTAVTISSRIASSGGFVTWAKSCVKYAGRSWGWSESTASGASLPMEPTGSAPSTAIGPMMRRTSSVV